MNYKSLKKLLRKDKNLPFVIVDQEYWLNTLILEKRLLVLGKTTIFLCELEKHVGKKIKDKFKYNYSDTNCNYIINYEIKNDLIISSLEIKIIIQDILIRKSSFIDIQRILKEILGPPDLININSSQWKNKNYSNDIKLSKISISNEHSISILFVL